MSEIRNLKSQFNAIAQNYDRQRTQFIPCFDDFYGIAVTNLRFPSADNLKFLDLGAGTGLFSEFVLQKYPSATITLVDISEQMLDIAKKRFEKNDNIHFVCQDFTLFKSEEKYDAIISSLAIHHLDDIQKVELYNKIYSLLAENGLFIHAEQVEGETPYLKELNNNRWKEGVENSELTQDEINAGYERVKLDKRSPLSTQLSWLKSIGFQEVDCLYKYYDFAVMYCKK